MDKLNIKKINALLDSSDHSQAFFAEAIGMKGSNLSSALNNERPLPFGYIFKIANFFNLENPKVLIESITTNENLNKVCEETE